MKNLSTDHYRNFEVDGFVNDTFFRNWVVAPNVESNKFWEEYLIKFPGKTLDIETARILLDKLKFETGFPDAQQIEDQFDRHMQMVDDEENERIEQLAKVRKLKIRRVMMAASFLGILLLSAALFFYYNSSQKILSYATGNGQLRHLLLPDSSEIVLNSNSQISFPEHWKPHSAREVWLKGEAYFNVRHLNKGGAVAENERFYVHGDDFRVEVLGTSFNVRDRRGKAEIVLQTGQVKLMIKHDQQRTWLMRPNDKIVYDRQHEKVQCSRTDAGNYTAWKENRLILNNPTLTEVTAYLEDNFGKKILIDNDRLKIKHIEGPILLDNLSDVLLVLSTAMNVRIDQNTKTDTIIIRPK